MEPEFGLGVAVVRARFIISVRGACDLSTRPTLAACLDQLPHDAVLDLTECALMDASTIGLLIATQRRLAEQGRTFAIANPNDSVREVLAICGADAVLHVEDGVVAA